MKTLRLILLTSVGLTGMAAAQSAVIGRNDTWDYLSPADGVDPATLDPDFASTWHGYTGYDGPAFTTTVAGPFSYGGITYFTAANGGPGSFIGVGGSSTAPPSGSRYTAYFKKQFTTATDLTGATVRMLADDGAIIYLDGIEVARPNMSNTTGDSYTMLADDVTNTETALIPDFTIGNISAGTHTIAVSLHNAGADSSDLGLWFELYGTAPPPPFMLRTNLSGVDADVRAAATPTGWVAGDPFAFSLNSATGTITSDPVDLTFHGEVFFTMQLYCYETSTGSNIEADDAFSASLILTLDDNSQQTIPLLPDDLDLDLSGTLNGDEFNPGLLPVTESILAGRGLSAVIPANAKSAVLSIMGDNDSTSEVFRFGGAMISDLRFDTDEDADGMTRGVEMFAGTDPADPASFLRIINSSYDLDTTTGEYEYSVTVPGVTGKRYAGEESADGGATWTYLGTVTSGVTGSYTAFVVLGAAPPERFFIRLRCIP